MKLLFVIPSITNYFTFLEDLIEELSERGNEVHLATSRKHIARISAYRREIKCAVHDIDFPRAINPFSHYSAARQLRKLVAAIQPDIVNVHFSAALFTAMIAREPQWPPTTGTIHGLGSPLIEGWRRYMIAKAEKWSAERADEVFVLTTDDSDYLQRNAPRAKVSVLDSFGMGCNLERFSRDAVCEERKAEIRQECGIEKDDFVYIFIGRQTHFKGYDKVVSAFVEVKKSHPRSKLILVGEKDRIHPTALEPSLERLIQTDPAFVAVGWRENVQDYLAVSQLNVFPSEREGLPVNLMESLAMGVPVVTINSRGCREVVEHGVNGLVIESRSKDALVQAMRQLQDDEVLRLTYARASEENRQKFDRRYFIDNQLEIFERITGMAV
jgi:glycosyltransferase involved in cell wall biosynthesis